MKAIMYHYVMPKDEKFPGLYRLDIKNFIKQLDFFQENFGFISRNEFFNSIKYTKKASEGVVLTFDDGLKCHYDYVFKELKKRNLWGIFYVNTLPFQKNKILDVHKIHILISRINPKILCDYLMNSEIQKLLDKQKINEFKDLTYWNQINDKHTLLVKRILNYFIEYKYRGIVLDGLFNTFIKNKINVDDYYLSIENLKEMKNEGMMVGNHTISHKVLSALSKKLQKVEIQESFNFIEQKIGVSNLKTFCYPYGGFHSFNKDTENILTKINTDFSFNVEKRDISNKDLLKRPHALPRYDCNQFKFGKNINN